MSDDELARLREENARFRKALCEIWSGEGPARGIAGCALRGDPALPEPCPQCGVQSRQNMYDSKYRTCDVCEVSWPAGRYPT